MTTPTTEHKKLSIICFSGDFDKLLAALTLASGSAAVNYDVSLFFTFWGLNAVKQKQRRRFVGRGFLARTFNFLMGGRNNLPLSRLNLFGASPAIMSSMMRKQNVATLPELLEACIALGIKMYACEMSMTILGMTKNDLIPEIRDVIGVASFMDYSAGGDRIFI